MTDHNARTQKITPDRVTLELTPAEQAIFNHVLAVTGATDPADLAKKAVMALDLAILKNSRGSRQPVLVEINKITFTVVI